MSKRDIGAEIIAGLKGFRDNPGSLKRYEFAPADVKSIREQFDMLQKRFADFLMISVRTLRKWEQGQRNPDGAAHALLRVMEREPDAVLRALHD
jgi:putative transcriptional regulator